jgi:hypothetical protein
LQSSTLATKMLLFTMAMATAKALDQRNVVVYDALNDDQQKSMSLSSQSSLPVLLSSSISIVMAKAGRKRCMCCICSTAQQLRHFMMRE